MSIPDKPARVQRRARLRNPQFHARLRRLIGAERPYAWADRVGISKGAFTRIWREGSVPTSVLLQRIQSATGISLDWLLTGQGQAARPESPSLPDLAFVAEFAADRRGKGRRPSSRRGRGSIALMRDWVVQWLEADPEELTFILVPGESMSPTLADGDLALVDRRANRPEGDGIYLLQQGATLRVRRVQRLSGDRYQALSDNPRYQPFTFRLTQRIIIVGRVVWAGKRM